MKKIIRRRTVEEYSWWCQDFCCKVQLPFLGCQFLNWSNISLCQIVVALWDCQIHADAVRALSWIFSMYFLLSDGGSSRLVKKTEVDLAIKPLHLTSIGNTFVIQPFLTHCSRRSSYFSNWCWCAQLKFSSKRTVNSIMKTFFALTDQMTISGRFVVNTISLGNMKLSFKSVATCQSMQPSSTDGLRISSLAVFEIFPSLTNWIALLLIIFRALLAVSQHVFEISEKISRTSLCLQV